MGRRWRPGSRSGGRLGNEGFCNSHYSPARKRLTGVQNPCPKSTSHNHPCHTVLRRSTAWDTCSATPASPPPTSTPSSKSTPSRRPAATECSPRPHRRPRRPPSPQADPGPAPPRRHPGRLELDRLGRSLRHLDDSVTSLADCGAWFHSLQEAIDTTRPGRQARLPRLRPSDRVRTRPDLRTNSGWADRCLGSRPPRRSTVGADRTQARGRTGDECVQAVLQCRFSPRSWA